MPYIKKQTMPFEKLQRLLKGYDVNTVKLASILECSTSTAWSKLKNPERFTLGDIKNICKKGHVPIEEIRSSITD